MFKSRNADAGTPPSICVMLMAALLAVIVVAVPPAFAVPVTAELLAD
jgi:hypothetical protein